MTSNWLQIYLAESIRRKLCTQIGCTTCGAMEFRLGVLSAMSGATGLAPRQKFDREASVEVARALADVTRGDAICGPLLSAVRCIVVDLSSGLPFLESEIDRLIAGSWAGEIQREMAADHKARMAARHARAEYESDANVEKRREEKRCLKQEQHALRVTAKQRRDQVWREQFGLTLAELDSQYRDTSVEIVIRSSDYWFKVVEFLQQNWALIDERDETAEVWFFGDTSGVFDKMTFPSVPQAEQGLLRNGFAQFAKDPQAREIIGLPRRPFHYLTHPNGPIYSSGRYWK